MEFYDKFLNLITPFVKWWGHLHLPFTHKKITGDDYYDWFHLFTPGTILLSTIDGELSNLLNPAKVKHAAIFVGGERESIVESIGKGVIKNNLVKFLTTKDRIVLIRPRFAKPEEMALAAEKAKEFIGREYDYYFKIGNNALYCYEVPVEAYKAVFPYKIFRCKEIVKGRKIYDHNTFFEDNNNWEVILDSGKR